MKKLLVSLLLVALVAGVASAELRAWYKFDETSGIDVADSSGNGFNTVITGDSSPCWNPDGAIGGSLEGDGQWTGMCIDVPTAVFSTVDTQLTITWWAQHTDLTTGGAWFAGNNGAGDQMLKALPYASGDSYYGVWRAGGTDVKWWWGYSNTVNVDEWHHFALVYDESLGGKGLYCNGELVGSCALDAGDAVDDVAAFRLFSRSATANAAWDVFKGKMDDVRIYDNALSQADIQALIPEPATLALLGLGGLTLIRRKK